MLEAIAKAFDTDLYMILYGRKINEESGESVSKRKKYHLYTALICGAVVLAGVISWIILKDKVMELRRLYYNMVPYFIFYLLSSRPAGHVLCRRSRLDAFTGASRRFFGSTRLDQENNTVLFGRYTSFVCRSCTFYVYTRFSHAAAPGLFKSYEIFLSAQLHGLIAGCISAVRSRYVLRDAGHVAT